MTRYGCVRVRVTIHQKLERLWNEEKDEEKEKKKISRASYGPQSR